MKLFYIILGATPTGRNIEQHDVFFGIAENLKELVPHMKDFWKEADGKIHIDCYQEVRFADGYEVKIVEKTDAISENQLYFINLGGYKKGYFEEFHEQHLMAGSSMGEVVKKVKETEFYKTMGFENAVSHIDDKHGVDIDDIFNVNDILPQAMKEKYSIILERSDEKNQENPMGLGYLKIDKI
ncbi:DUF1543 domain-containing protein [Chryseobacterium daecheongense]|uniref:DUF1543 domain-containing protein n=1 Tax=Chryseobacterium daecheongense TaxID=192389 RepID=A0A3N0W5I9_9FLAO|nr:DUF1543 domain-containing protein [Chryseobacterium daecheongense]ROI00324.1 DUF1543 domain-containing protein [Chryseobacterium daecheongense]TDX94714.1 uncharacterized protein DUF1543 [Chryseobacterium daecheongense]